MSETGPTWESDEVKRQMQAVFEEAFLGASQVAAPLTVDDYTERMKAMLTTEQVIEQLERLSRWQTLPYDDRQVCLAAMQVIRVEKGRADELTREMTRQVETMREVRQQLAEMNAQVAAARGTESVPEVEGEPV